jgi:hypothetical protein
MKDVDYVVKNLKTRNKDARKEIKEYLTSKYKEASLEKTLFTNTKYVANPNLIRIAILKDITDVMGGIDPNSVKKTFEGVKLKKVNDVTSLKGGDDYTEGVFHRKGKYYFGRRSQALDRTKGKEVEVVDSIRLFHAKTKQRKRIQTKVKTVGTFAAKNTADIGSMVWAEGMGSAMSAGMDSQFKKDIEKGCDLSYKTADDVLKEYTVNHLYFIGKGMGLNVTRKMTRPELCQLIREELV